MVRDKTLDIFLMVLFGMGGITILVITWAQPMPLLERIVTASIGSIGLFWVLVRLLICRFLRADTSVTSVPVEAQSKDGQ